MSSLPIDEQDTAQRLSAWVTVLEERIVALLQGNDPETMKPAEREQAASRHLAMLLRLLQMRQKFAPSEPSPGEKALLDAILQGHRSGDYDE